MIELVAVIVILGILSASALPKFLDVRTSAVIAATQSLEGAVRAAMNNLRGKCFVTAGCNVSSGTSYITVDGVSFQIWNGWVDAGDNLNNNEIDRALSTSRFDVTLSPMVHRFTHQSARVPGSCYVEYKEAVNAGSEPTVTSVTTGC